MNINQLFQTFPKNCIIVTLRYISLQIFFFTLLLKGSLRIQHLKNLTSLGHVCWRQRVFVQLSQLFSPCLLGFGLAAVRFLSVLVCSSFHVLRSNIYIYTLAITSSHCCPIFTLFSHLHTVIIFSNYYNIFKLLSDILNHVKFQ